MTNAQIAALVLSIYLVPGVFGVFICWFSGSKDLAKAPPAEQFLILMIVLFFWLPVLIGYFGRERKKRDRR